MHRFSFLIVTLVFLLQPSFAFAQTVSPELTPRPQTIIQERKQQLQERLQTFRDTRKKAVIERIQTKMVTTNTKATRRMLEAVQKMKILLTATTAKATALKTAGKDTTTVDQAILSATTAITTAETAVTTQAAKEYVITVNTETTARNDVGAALKLLEADLQSTHKLVVDAKQAIQHAMAELAKINPREKEASTAATNTN